VRFRDSVMIVRQRCISMSDLFLVARDPRMGPAQLSQNIVG